MSQLVEKEHGACPRVLVIDDDKFGAETIAKLIESTGHRAQWATNAEEALRILSQSHFDLCLCDWRMDHESPWGDFALLEKIKKVKPNAPVLMFSGWNPETDWGYEAGQLGAVGFVAREKVIKETAQVMSLAMSRHRGSLVE